MNKVLKSTLSIAAAVAVSGIAIVPAVSAWGNNNSADNTRPTYSLADINAGKLGNKIVFNSIVDTNENLSEENKKNGVIIPLHDERNFVSARVDDGKNLGKDNVWSPDTIKVEEGKTYIIRLYVHNNNPNGTGVKDENGNIIADTVAKNVATTFQLPKVVSKEGKVSGIITTDSGEYTRYWDSVVFQSDRNFYLDYIEGSALIESNGKVGNTTLSDAIVTDGTKIGYDSLDGNIPGCYTYASYITIKVKPVFEDTSIEKFVRLVGEKEWKKSVDAKIGDKVEYQIHYKNMNASEVNNVIIRDSLPTNMKYIDGTTQLFNTNHPNGASTKDNTLVTDGVNIGKYAVKGDAYVRFTAEVVDKDLVCGNNRLINWAKATANGFAVQNSADVYVKLNADNAAEKCKKEEPKEDPKPETPKDKFPDDKPTELPTTGPASVAAAATGLGAIVTSAGYFVTSRKQLKK